MREVILDERLLDASSEAHEILREALAFPAYYGSNLSALSDCLEDVCEASVITCVQHPDEDERAAWFEDMMRVIGRCASDNSFIDFHIMDAADYDATLPKGVMRAGALKCMKRLQDGNERFMASSENHADISSRRVDKLFRHGQHPFATVICCADSRVVPEHLFMCGLGDIFTIRVAGNVVSESVAASAVYACGHLHTELLVMLGHTACGAVAAALEGGDHGSVNPLVDCICGNIGGEQDPDKASVLNVEAGIAQLREVPELAQLEGEGKVAIVGALYHADTGKVEFL